MKTARVKYNIVQSSDIVRFGRMDAGFLIKYTELKNTVQALTRDNDRQALDAMVEEIGFLEEPWRLVSRIQSNSHLRFPGKFNERYTDHDVAVYLAMALKDVTLNEQAEKKEAEASKLRERAQKVQELLGGYV